jgi:hypothetical protein
MKLTVPDVVVCPDDLVRLGDPPLRLASARHRQEPHGEPSTGTDHRDPGRHSCDEHQGGVPGEPAGDLGRGQLALGTRRVERPAAPCHAGREAREQQGSAHRHDRHGRKCRA